MQRRDDLVFAVDGVRRWQQRARWLATQHEAFAAGLHQEGGIRLPALELRDLQVSGKRPDVGANEIGQPAFVEGMLGSVK